ncbi:DUF6318 family protein [Trueperella bialowiezensis]|uniref:DUF6318 domain-containing protein n=1 Tax=Trueperella bialowiezensis TaxID=312285 RepID=A0A3S4V5K1_9ACTO|nr:DUF6318 family protein [Trueperella bialowiezensis]VEI12570.1 Uncharacterised protein [Trueperella bialowiezensis]
MGVQRRRFRALRLGAGLVCAAAVLAACGGADPADGGGSASPATGGSAVPTEEYTIPPRPQVMPPSEPVLTGVELEDAAALAEYYVKLYPYVKKTGDTAEWEKYAHPECEYCQTVIESANNMNQVGAWTDINLGVVETAWFSSTGKLDYRMDFLVDRSEIHHYNPEGSDYLEANRHAVIIGLVVEEGLKVRSFDILDQDKFGVPEL